MVAKYVNKKNAGKPRVVAFYCYPYCAFHKHANSKINGSPSQLRFSLPSIIITITSNEPWNTETLKTNRNPPITNHKPWPFEPVKFKFCFLRGPLRWLTAATKAIVSWFLNFTIRMFVKCAVIVSNMSKLVIQSLPWKPSHVVYLKAPLLFLLYINDLPGSSKKLTFTIFCRRYKYVLFFKRPRTITISYQWRTCKGLKILCSK